MAQNLEGMMSTSMDKIRELVDVNTIIGEPITAPDGTILIPVSKVSFGFVSGGSDLPATPPKNVFAGGSGAGVTIKPMTFVVIKTDGDVKLLEVSKENNIMESVFESAPEFIEKIKGLFLKKKKDETPDSDNSG
ncbi:MAG: GerW family sporulation protein [Oscillospiraceae bacterium]|nr:GerW family sporulation protein [Oscillospiraceae bacterium]